MSINITVPEVGESIVDARVARWLKKEGDAVAAGEPLVELETDKVDVEVAAPKSGVLRAIAHKDGADVKIGDVLGTIEEGVAPKPNGKAAVPVTPVAKPPAVTKPPASAPPKPRSGEGVRSETRTRMSKRRATIAKRLVEAQQTAAMLTTFNEVDMSAVMTLRDRQKEAFKAQHGVPLGIASFFVRAACAALKEFPRLNAEIQGDEMVLKNYYDIGVAVGAAEGLVVPVLRDADRMNFAAIEAGIRDFARRANDSTLTLDDLRGGTFSITNGGVYGSLMSTPILNPPQVGILGLHAIKDRPAAVAGQVVIRPMMYLALTYDHRIVDGSDAVRFLVRVKELIEDPAALLLQA